MRGHLPAPHHGGMDPAPALYMIRINGHLGATVLSAFPAMAPHRYGAHTVLTGLLDRSALYGVLAEIDALGLDLLEVRQLEPDVGRYRSTRSSPGLRSSAGRYRSPGVRDEPRMRSRMSASSAACAVWCRGSASSNSREPVIANGSTSRSGSARANARSAAWSAARWSPSWR